MEMPYEPYVYIVTKVKGSTIHARRVNDWKTKCRDASKVKPLRTARMTEIQQETITIKVPPSYQVTTSQITYKKNDGSNSNNEPLNQNEEQPITVIQNTTEVQVRIDENDPRPRRSERQNKSIYDGKYKGYVK